MTAPKILIITPSLGTGGAQKVFNDQLHFYSQHFQVTACIFNWDGALEGEKNREIVSLQVPAGKTWISKIYYFHQRILRLKRLKRKLGIDISISHLEGADYVNILSRRGEKIICYIHGTKFHDGAIHGFLGWIRKKILMPNLYRKANLIITVSEGIKKELLSYLEIASQKIKVITNGFDVNRIEGLTSTPIPAEIKTLFDQHKTICLCSRLAPQKNQKSFFLIFDALRKTIDSKLIVLGDGELRDSLIEYADQLGLRVYNAWSANSFSHDSDVFFLGNQLNPFPYIAKASVFALPSAWEGFPLALCEAMACSVPVVSSDCPTGPKEILYDEETSVDYGFLLPIPVENNHAILEQWVNVLSRILTDQSLATDYAMRAKQRVKKFDKEKMEVSWRAIVNV